MIINRTKTVTVASIAERDAMMKVQGMNVIVTNATENGYTGRIEYKFDGVTKLWVIMTDITQLKRLTSDDTTLDEMQEIVNYIKESRVIAATSITRGTGWKDTVLNFSNDGIKSIDSPVFTFLVNDLGFYQFASNRDQYVDGTLHIDHDIKPNTSIIPYINWMPETAAIGTIVWEIEYMAAQSHTSGELLDGITTKVQVSTSTNGIPYENIRSEIPVASAIGPFEVDTIIKINLRRLSSSPLNTYNGGIHLISAGATYQSDRDVTLNKQPDFYV